jgi:hypothetical protein
MHRSLRSWTQALCLPAAVLAAGSAAAGTACTPTAQAGVDRCVAGLPAAAVREMRLAQAASNWCWAASISMVLRRYGVQVPQETVVQARLGAAANEKVRPEAITELLNRSWRDADGRVADIVASPVPAWWRQQGMVAPDVLDDLHHEKPLVLAVHEHAMVLVQVVYERSANRPVRLLQALVLDPAGGGALRSLRASEGQPEYLARVQLRAPTDQVAARQ